MVQSKDAKLEIIGTCIKHNAYRQGVVQSKGNDLEIFEHVYHIMHIVRGGPVERF